MLREHERVLKLYLKYGLTRRAIERVLRLTVRGGKSAQDIIDKYGVRSKELRGRLLGCDREQFEKVKTKLALAATRFEARTTRRCPEATSAYRKVVQRQVERLVPQAKLGLLAPYIGRAVVAKNARHFHEAIKGEVANITQQVFDPCKRLVGACENRRCRASKKSKRLDTAHIGQPRPVIFRRSAVVAVWGSPVSGHQVFDLYGSMRTYLQCHLRRRNRVRFLCAKCHKSLGALERLSVAKKLTVASRKSAKRQLAKFKKQIH